MNFKINNSQSEKTLTEPITPSKTQLSKLSEDELDKVVAGLSWGGWSSTSYTYQFW